MKTALLLINRHSRSGAQSAERAEALLKEQGFNCLVPEEGDDFRQLVRQYAGRADLTVIGGGDGTLNHLAGVLLKTKATIGILPLGTANDLCRTLGIPESLDEAIDVLVAGRKQCINVGMVNNKPFFNVASIGFGTDVNRSLDKRLKKNWGVLSYAIAALKTLFVYRPFRVTMHAGDRVLRTRAVHIAVGNGCYYGGGMRVHKDADIAENSLCAYVLKPSYPFRLVLGSRRFMEGEFDEIPGVRFLKHDTVSVETRYPRTVYADGEEITKTPVLFTMVRDALEVMVPDIRQMTAGRGSVEETGERHAA